ncbi:MAG: ATP-binding protein, partial [Calditrichia bacterium]
PEKLRVLIIENGVLNARSIADLLLRWNNQFEVNISENLEEAMYLLMGSSFDVILLNLSLPEHQGIDTVMKVNFYFPEIPVILLVRESQDETVLEKAMKAGAQDFLTVNELNSHLILRSIRYAIEKKSLQLELDQHKQNIRKYHQWFRRFVANNDDAILVLDPGGTILFSNDAAASLEPAAFEKVAAHFRNGMKKDRNNFELEMDGENDKRYFRAHSKHTFWEGERVYLVSLQEITPQKKYEKSLNESEEKYLLLAKKSADAIFILQNNKVVFVNPAWEKLFGFTFEEVKEGDFNIPDMFKSDGREKVSAYLEIPSNNGKKEQNFEFTAFTKDHREIEVALAISEITWQGKPAIQGIEKNISIRKKQEKEIARLASVLPHGEEILAGSDKQLSRSHDSGVESGRQLNDPFAGNNFSGLNDEEYYRALLNSLNSGKYARNSSELTRIMNNLVERLRKSFTGQQEFLAEAAHELKSPLAILRAHWEGELNNPDIPLAMKEKLVQDVETISRLSHLINNLLMLSKTGAMDWEKDFRPVRLDQVLDDVLADAEVMAELKSQELRIPELPEITVRGDQERLYQLYLNLIENAIKYTPEGGKVRISHAVEDNQFVIGIHDNGPGIPSQDLPRIFERFYRVRNGNMKKTSGSGLGLSICKLIAETHQGKIDVQSKEGEGSTFFVKLPLK